MTEIVIIMLFYARFHSFPHDFVPDPKWQNLKKWTMYSSAIFAFFGKMVEIEISMPIDYFGALNTNPLIIFTRNPVFVSVSGTKKMP